MRGGATGFNGPPLPSKLCQLCHPYLLPPLAVAPRGLGFALLWVGEGSKGGYGNDNHPHVPDGRRVSGRRRSLNGRVVSPLPQGELSLMEEAQILVYGGPQPDRRGTVPVLQ